MYSLSKKESSTVDGMQSWLMQRVPEGTWVLQEPIV